MLNLPHLTSSGKFFRVFQKTFFIFSFFIVDLIRRETKKSNLDFFKTKATLILLSNSFKSVFSSLNNTTRGLYSK